MKTHRHGLIFVLSALLALFAIGCSGELTFVDDPGGGTTTPPATNDPATFFTQNLATPVGVCASCHESGVAGAPIFLPGAAAGDLRTIVLNAQTAQGPFVNKAAPGTSILINYTHVSASPNLAPADGLLVEQWLALEP